MNHILPSNWCDDQEQLVLHRLYCQNSLISYTRAMAPWMILEEVHCAIASYLEAVALGEIDRLMIFAPPRTGKSMMSSVIFPSWWAGKFPTDKIMQIGYKTDLPKRFSRQVRNIVMSREYNTIFPGVEIAQYARAAGYWNFMDINEEYHNVARAGEYQAAGVTAGIAGSGFHLGNIDDPLSEQDKDSKIAKDRVWEWYGPGFYTRRQPGRNFIVVTMTRWATDDLAGRLLDAGKHGGDRFEVLNIPAILDGNTARKLYLIAKGYDALPETKELKGGESFSPVRIPTAELERSKRNMTTRDWLALYMGSPVEDEGAIIKVAWWRLWPKDEPPECVFVFQMYDTAFEEHENADYSAMTTWGVFEYTARDGRSTFNMILLDKWKRRVEAPDLPKVVTAYCHGSDSFEEKDRKEVIELCRGEGLKTKIVGHHPDSVMIENKASGIWLIKELRRRTNPAIPVKAWNPPRGTNGEKGKYARAQLSTLVFEQGAVWYMDKDWAAEVIDGCGKCRFDGSDESDDLEDTVTAAVIYVRQTYRVETESEINEKAEAEAELEKSRSEKRYYGSR